MKDLIKKILREEVEEKVLAIPGLQYFGGMESPEERLETWNKVLSYVGDRKFKINGNLILGGTPIKSLENLRYVGGFLSLRGTPIESLENLEYVDKHLYLNELLSEKYTDEEIKSQVTVIGEIYREK